MNKGRKEGQKRPEMVVGGLHPPDSSRVPEWAGCLCSVFRQMRDGLALFRLQEKQGESCLILEDANPAVEDLLGVPAAELRERLGAPGREQWLKTLTEVARDGESVTVEEFFSGSMKY